MQMEHCHPGSQFHRLSAAASTISQCSCLEQKLIGQETSISKPLHLVERGGEHDLVVQHVLLQLAGGLDGNAAPHRGAAARR